LTFSKNFSIIQNLNNSSIFDFICLIFKMEKVKQRFSIVSKIQKWHFFTFSFTDWLNSVGFFRRYEKLNAVTISKNFFQNWMIFPQTVLLVDILIHMIMTNYFRSYFPLIRPHVFFYSFPQTWWLARNFKIYVLLSSQEKIIIEFSFKMPYALFFHGWPSTGLLYLR
jgi:hypothetical protein